MSRPADNRRRADRRQADRRQPPSPHGDDSWLNSSRASSEALSGVKLPVMMPDPPVMALLMTGAEMILPSRTMANFLLILRAVASPNLRAPWPLKLNETTGLPLWESKVWRESVSSSPDTTARLRTA